MVLMQVRWLAAAVSAFLAAAPALAQTGATPPASDTATAAPAAVQAVPDIEPVQVTLTPDLVQRFLKSYPELIALGKELDKKRPPPETTDSDEAPAFVLQDHLGDPGAAADINRVLNKNGFDTYADWANVAHSVALAAEASEPDSALDDLDGQKQQALADIDADASLSDKDKEQARAEVDDQFAALSAFVPLPGNIDTVKPFLEQIRALGASE
jgi:hypothetical protein